MLCFGFQKDCGMAYSNSGKRMRQAEVEVMTYISPFSLIFPLDPFSEKFLGSLNDVEVKKLCMGAINKYLYNGKLYFFLSNCVKLPRTYNKR